MTLGNCHGHLACLPDDWDRKLLVLVGVYILTSLQAECLKIRAKDPQQRRLFIKLEYLGSHSKKAIMKIMIKNDTQRTEFLAKTFNTLFTASSFHQKNTKWDVIMRPLMCLEA